LFQKFLYLFFIYSARHCRFMTKPLSLFEYILMLSNQSFWKNIMIKSLWTKWNHWHRRHLNHSVRLLENKSRLSWIDLIGIHVEICEFYLSHLLSKYNIRFSLLILSNNKFKFRVFILKSNDRSILGCSKTRDSGSCGN
jgi:hypothetical protein